MTVPVYILNWNAKVRTIECLDTVLRSRGVDCDPYVVDNGSTDGSPEEMAALLGPAKILRNNRNMGYGGGMNRALRHFLTNTTASHAVLLTNDTLLEPTALQALLSESRKRREAGVVGPLVLLRNTDEQVFSAGGYIDFSKHRVGHHRYCLKAEPYEVDWVDGCCWVVSRSAVERVGLFEESYFIYYDETEWCVKAGSAGYAILVVPVARVWQLPGASESWVTHYYLSRNGLLFWRRLTGKTSWPTFGRLLWMTALSSMSFAKATARDAFCRGAGGSLARLRFSVLKARVVGYGRGAFDYFKGRTGSIA